jgi:hypothetical protein
MTPPTKGAHPGRRANYTSEPKATAPTGTSTKAAKGVPVSTPRKVLLPRLPRSSAITLTVSEGAKASYAEVIKAVRGKIRLAEVGIGTVGMRKAMTGTIIIEDPGDKDREKASTLATRPAQILDPATVKVADPTRMAELRVAGFDVFVDKEELRDALALAAGCGSAEIQVREIGTSRSGLNSAWVRCPLAGAHKLSQARRIALGWSTARVGHREEALAVLQMFRAWTYQGDVRVHGVPVTPVLHVRRTRQPC